MKVILSKPVHVRMKAAAMHLLVSLTVAGFAGLLVFGLWYPSPYGELAGGTALFLLVLGIDVVCGPFLTLVLFNVTKPRKELIRDLSFVALIQLSALAYGIYAVTLGRPVLLAFEVDRFRVITAAEIDREQLPKAPEGFRELSLTGPRTIGVRIPVPTDPDFMKSLDLSLAGLEVSYRPAFWRPFEEQHVSVLKKAIPLAQLRARYAGQKALIDEAVARSGQAEDTLGYLPVQSRRSSAWVAFVDRRTANVVSFAPLDGF